MRQALMLISILILSTGLYLKYFYDVPDEQIAINFFTSWFLIIIGTAGVLMNIFGLVANLNF